MPPVQQTPRALATKISRHEHISRVHPANVYQTRQRVTGTESKVGVETLAQLHAHSAIETIPNRHELLEFTTRWVRPKLIQRRKSGVKRRCRGARQVHHRQRHTKLNHTRDRIRIRWIQTRMRKPDQLTRIRRIVQRTNTTDGIDEVCEVTRREKLGEVAVTSRQHGRVRVELAPQVYAARESEVCFDRIPATQIALDAGVELIAFRYAQRRIQPPRKISVQDTKLPHQRRIRAKRLRKTNVSSNERASLLGGQQFSVQRIAQGVRVEEELLLAECEVVDRAQ